MPNRIPEIPVFLVDVQNMPVWTHSFSGKKAGFPRGFPGKRPVVLVAFPENH